MSDKSAIAKDELKDVVVFAQGVVDDLHKYIDNDGKLDTAEIAMTLVKNAPNGIKAVAGAKDISFADLDAAGKEELAKMAITLSKSIVAFFVPDVMKV